MAEGIPVLWLPYYSMGTVLGEGAIVDLHGVLAANQKLQLGQDNEGHVQCPQGPLEVQQAENIYQH